MTSPGSQRIGNRPETRRGNAASCVAVSVLNLPVHCTLPQAQTLRASFLAALAADADIHLDAGATETVDTAALQVIVAFVTELRLQGRRARWQTVSTPLRLAAQQLGLLQILGLEPGVTAS